MMYMDAPLCTAFFHSRHYPWVNSYAIMPMTLFSHQYIAQCPKTKKKVQLKQVVLKLFLFPSCLTPLNNVDFSRPLRQTMACQNCIFKNILPVVDSLYFHLQAALMMVPSTSINPRNSLSTTRVWGYFSYYFSAVFKYFYFFQMNLKNSN